MWFFRLRTGKTSLRNQVRNEASPSTDRPPHSYTLLTSTLTCSTISCCQQYLTKRFSQSYKATIGCDFVTAFVPLSPETTATLSIWDTAGQERFASLSTAFFRGSDAAILVYDVTKPETLANLRRWFGVFEDRCPVEGLEGKRRFCFLVVGNKGDLASTLDSGSGHLNDFNIVKEEDARALFNELIPPRPQPPSSPSSAPANPSASSAPHSFSDSSSNQASSSPSSAFSSALNSVTTRIRSFSSATPTARASSPGPSSSSHHLVSSGAVPAPSSPSTSSAPQDVHSSTLASIEIVSSPPASGPSTLTTTTSIYHDALSSFCDPSTSSPRQNGSASNPVFPPPSSIYSFSTARSDGSSACGSGPRPTSPVNSSALPSVFSSSSPLSTSPAGAGGFPKWDLRLSSKRAASIASMSSSLGSSTSTIRPANAQPRSTSRSRPRKASGGSSLRPKMTDHGPRGETSTEDPLGAYREILPANHHARADLCRHLYLSRSSPGCSSVWTTSRVPSLFPLRFCQDGRRCPRAV